MNRNILQIPCYDISKFKFERISSGSRRALCDASELHIPAGALPGQRVWADACDVGFTVKGEGETKLFTLSSADFRRIQGVYCSWTFNSEDGKFVIVIFND